MPERASAVFVRGIEFEANHGYTAAERRSTRRFRVDVTLEPSLAKASCSDQLRDTIDYREVCQTVVTLGTESTFKLLEALTGHIGRSLVARYPGVDVTVELQKLAPACPGVPAAAGVRMRFP